METQKVLAGVEGLEGLRKLKESEAFLRKRDEDFEIIQKDLSNVFSSTKQKLAEYEENLKLIVASWDVL